MQEQTISTVSQWVPIGLTILGIIITISIPIISYAFSSIHKRVDELRDSTEAKIAEVKKDAEDKRIETRDTILDLVNEKFEAIKDTLKDIKDELKGTN